MKKVEHYICEICGTEYNEKQKALSCERCHCAPAEIKKARFLPERDNKKGYPISVEIRMADGTILTYKR